MAIRKEQVLALLTLGIGALVARSVLQEAPRAQAWNPTRLEYAAVPVPPAVLAGNAKTTPARRDFCTEPSETRPLPPRELDFPPRAALSIAGLPLDPGPDYGHLWAVRMDGAAVESVTLQATAEGAAPPAPGPADAGEPGQGGATRKEREARAALTYDQVWVVGLKAPFFGTIEADGQDLFALEDRRDFDGVELRLRSYNVDTGKVGSLVVYGKDERRIEKVELAHTLRNEVARRIRSVPVLPSHLVERRQLIDWLLDKAREATWVYDAALEQAELYRQVSQGDLDGLRLQQRVLQARGDLAAEFALLDGLSGPHRESAFRYEGLGVLKARLGLVIEAEQDLRKAVSLSPTDARPHTALAEFLRQRGRSREALLAARRAEQSMGSLLTAADRVRAVRTVVACHLAVGDVEAARVALQLLPVESPQPYLEGCVSYAAGQVTAALGQFRQASGSTDGPAALLAQGACLLREGQWQEAHDLLARVVDQEPLLRHRAATGLALLFCRLRQFDSALVWIDRALEADPQDPYAFYLRGRALRLQGQLAAAAEALGAALRLRDDFVHAIAEMAALQAQRAEEARGDDQAAAALSARRYADRAVELVPTPAVELFERQGLHRFRAADVRGAAAAFEAARDLAATEPEKLFARGSLAVVDYSRGLVEDAAGLLQRLVQDLQKEDPIRVWATATLAGIDDHAQKEMLEDGFERAEVGSVWRGERDGSLGAEIRDNGLVFQGKLGRTGGGEVFVERLGAVQKAKNFLAVGCSLQLGKGQPHGDGFAGLRIEMQRGGGGVECRVQLGVREGKPYLRIEDGRAEGREDVVQKALEIADLDLGKAQQLELRVVPRGDVQSKTFALQARWNGVLVHVHDLKTLTANTQTELKTILFAGGTKGNDIDVRFDDYRLERRRER